MGGMCPAMHTLEAVVAEIAPTNIPVLLVGESGTGKAMFAQRMHRLSSRSDKQLVNIICAAMNPAQLSTELGLTSSANGNGHANPEMMGTVVFDEISELDSICQRNLLYTLPDGDGSSRRGTLGSASDFHYQPESRRGNACGTFSRRTVLPVERGMLALASAAGSSRGHTNSG